MSTKAKAPPVVVRSRNLSAYRLTKKHQAILQKWKEMRAWMRLGNGEPQSVVLFPTDYHDINAAVCAQSEGKFSLADVRYENVPVLSAEISAQEGMWV